MAGNLPPASRVSPVRDRILEASYELFSRRGIRAVGVDELIERAGVAKASLYRHFPSKDDLVVAFLERREQRWTNGWVEREARRRGSGPEDQLLAIFEAFDEWFRREDFEACSFINVLLELGPRHPAGSASVRHLENIRSIVRGLAEQAGLRDPGVLRSLLAHPHEGIDHRGRRGRRGCRAASPVDGPPPDRRPPLTPRTEGLTVTGPSSALRLRRRRPLGVGGGTAARASCGEGRRGRQPLPRHRAVATAAEPPRRETSCAYTHFPQR